MCVCMSPKLAVLEPHNITNIFMEVRREIWIKSSCKGHKLSEEDISFNIYFIKIIFSSLALNHIW